MESVLQAQKKQFTDIQEKLEKEMLNEFDELIFNPIQTIFPKKEKKQIKSKTYPQILNAFANGSLIYSQQRQAFFVKKHSTELATELNQVATYNNIERNYKATYDFLPIEIQGAIASQINQAEELTNQIDTILATAMLVIGFVNFKEKAKPLIEKTAEITVETLNDKIKTDIELTKPDAKTVYENFYTGYADAIDKNIKNFSVEEIEKLRKQVAEIRLQGGNVEQLRDVLNKGYNITESRVKLIVRQETNLANSSYEQIRQKQAGNRYFKWVHPNPNKETARPHHVEWAEMSKNGTLFDMENPPRNPTTGEPEMPSEPFNCDCYAVYVKPKDNS